MTWDQGLAKLLNKGDKQFDRLFESASEWRLKAVTFAMFGDKRRAGEALRKCYLALHMAANRAKKDQPKEFDFNEFWEEFSPGSARAGADSLTAKRSRKKSIQISENGSVTVPLPLIDDEAR